MSVDIIWSLTDSGTTISSIVDHSNASNGSSTTKKKFYIRHTGDASITDVKLYFRQFSGTYTGSNSASADFTEILAWGDETEEDDFGGAFISFNDSLDAGTWPTYDNKQVAATHFVLSTGYGNSEANAIILPIATGANTEGEIASSETDVTFSLKFQIPTNEDTIGIRQIETVITYNFTS